MEKNEQRRIARGLRRALSPQMREQASEEICRSLRNLSAVQRSQVIFSYLAMPSEVDLRSFHMWAIEQGITLAFPVTAPDGSMEAYAPTGNTRWQRDRFGISAPVAQSAIWIPPEAVELILTPCVAFDESCRRLGQGGGYYDRYFARCPQALRLAVAFEVQKLPALLPEPHDLPVHAVQTERRLYGSI